jgi:hypothetical protein
MRYGQLLGINALVANRARNTAAKVTYGTLSPVRHKSEGTNASDMDEGSFVALIKEFFFASMKPFVKPSAPRSSLPASAK